LSSFEIGAAAPAGGIELAAAILKAMKRNAANEIIGKIEQEDDALVDQILRRMFVFEDLLAVDDRAMQAILAEVDQVDLAAALRMAGDELRKKIFRNISSARAAKAVRRQMKTRGPLRVSEIKKAQQVMIGVARRLEQEGKIVLAECGDERFI
jgi:flagellar motor switch protein FliG